MNAQNKYGAVMNCKKLFTFSLVLLFFQSIGFAQLAESSWGLGFGASYPRLISTTNKVSDINYGGYFSLQRNFSEHSALRLITKYSHFESEAGTPVKTAKTDAVWGSFDMLYYFVPCEPVSPFLTAGIGANYMQLTEKITPTLKDAYLTIQLNLSLGVEWSLGEYWKIKSELGYHTLGNNTIDGSAGTGAGGLLGSNTDSFMSFDLGFFAYFGKGEPSKLCQLYSGIRVDEVPGTINYDKIENIVKKYVPQEVVKEVVVEKPTYIEKPVEDRWILVGVSFDFNSAEIKEESYPALLHAVQVLLNNPEMKVEIQGHTDNVGTEKQNLAVSQARAESVRNYLIARNIGADRLIAKGYGESQPIGDNKTADGRAMNRRIEFKVLNK